MGGDEAGEAKKEIMKVVLIYEIIRSYNHQLFSDPVQLVRDSRSPSRFGGVERSRGKVVLFAVVKEGRLRTRRWRTSVGVNAFCEYGLGVLLKVKKPETVRV